MQTARVLDGVTVKGAVLKYLIITTFQSHNFNIFYLIIMTYDELLFSESRLSFPLAFLSAAEMGFHAFETVSAAVLGKRVGFANRCSHS